MLYVESLATCDHGVTMWSSAFQMFIYMFDMISSIFSLLNLHETRVKAWILSNDVLLLSLPLCLYDPPWVGGLQGLDHGLHLPDQGPGQVVLHTEVRSNPYFESHPVWVSAGVGRASPGTGGRGASPRYRHSLSTTSILPWAGVSGQVSPVVMTFSSGLAALDLVSLLSNLNSSCRLCSP